MLSVITRTFTKPKLIEKPVVYKNYRNFNGNTLNRDFHDQISSEKPKVYASFEKKLISILEEHAPLRKSR